GGASKINGYALRCVRDLSQTNSAPVDIVLESANLLEKQPVSTVVGQFSAADDRDGTLYYKLVPGTGADDNAGFRIMGDQLITTQIYDYAVRQSLSIRVRVTDTGGKFYEEVIPISILDINEVTDIDGYKYRTIRIGDQEWFADNLKVTRYANGEVIPSITDQAQWNSLTTGGRCVFLNDANFVNTYGRLYNWYSVADPRGVCPAGWVVPGDPEFQALSDYLGDFNGTKAKETSGWLFDKGTNESGFSARPGGRRDTNGFNNFMTINPYTYGWWWSSTEAASETTRPSIEMSFNASVISKVNQGITSGLSIRCVRDVFPGNMPPGMASISSAKLMEGQPAGTLVGRLSAADDRDGSVYFSLVTGTGSDDNSGFTISGGRLLTTRAFDYAVKPTLSVRVRASDAGGLFSETVLTIDLIDV
ncbi:MAG: FISUMP domain-containing protein, partial [Bacteroidota bacterium]